MACKKGEKCVTYTLSVTAYTPSMQHNTINDAHHVYSVQVSLFLILFI
jgi:hypothetical protein